LRFKADEASQAITGAYRQNHPDDNNERQAIHEHVSAALNADKSKKAAAARKPVAGETTSETRPKTLAATKAGGGSR
jgi:hypothetical protein